METINDRCPSCNTAYIDHLGLIGTCRALQEERAEVRRLRELLASDAVTLRNLVAVETERDRYREALERVADHTREAGQWELICIARNALQGEEECK